MKITITAIDMTKIDNMHKKLRLEVPAIVRRAISQITLSAFRKMAGVKSDHNND